MNQLNYSGNLNQTHETVKSINKTPGSGLEASTLELGNWKIGVAQSTGVHFLFVYLHIYRYPYIYSVDWSFSFLIADIYG